MQPEHIQSFHERLNQWVASQGFWFQVRHSAVGSNLGGRAMYQLMRMALRLLIFLLVLAAGTWVYLVKRSESPQFRAALDSSIRATLHAKNMEFGFIRQQSQLEITRLGAEGAKDTFFSTLEARNIRCRMNLINGLIGKWDPGVVSISRLDIDLRAGADDAAEAGKMAAVLFAKPKEVAINTLTVANANLRWGYSSRNRGSIQSSNLTIQRTQTGWRFTFKGGTFTQNWLKDLTISEIVAVCEPQGLFFEKAELKNGSSPVVFTGTRVEAGERPIIRGNLTLKNLKLDTILPPALEPILSGSVSADLRISGSTNSSDGVIFDGMMIMDGTDVISLRDRIPLLKALSVVDYSRSYHRIDFNEGSFQFKTMAGGMELREIRLRAEDAMTLEGDLAVRLPNDNEVKAAVDRGLFNASSLADLEGAASVSNSLKLDFSLKRAADEAKRDAGPQNPDQLSLFERLGLSVEMRKLQSEAAERLSRMLRYDGNLVITLSADAFERAPKLQNRYPVIPESGRLAVPIPVNGYLDEVTLDQAEQLYEEGQR